MVQAAIHARKYLPGIRCGRSSQHPRDDPVTVVSVYNIIDDVYAQTTLLRIVADLIPLFDSPDGSRVILGGDLNMSTAAAKGPERDRAASILGALKGLGLVDLADVELAEGKRPEPWPDCPCQEPDCRHFPTWRAGHLDHLFVTPALTDQVRSLHVDRDVVERGLSDHAALIATLDLDPRPIAHEWDPKTFVEEIRRRHGEEDARTVEELIAWAEVKEQSLRVANRRDRSLTRLPVSAEVDPEMWWQIDFPPERPTAIQWTLSIQATGEIVIQFQRMKHPPFDTEAGREPLRALLNSVPSIDIRAGPLEWKADVPTTGVARSTGEGGGHAVP